MTSPRSTSSLGQTSTTAIYFKINHRFVLGINQIDGRGERDRLTACEFSHAIHDRIAWESFVDTASQIAPTTSPVTVEVIGRVTSISGGQAKITLGPSTSDRASDHHATVGKFLGIQTGVAVIIGLISAVDQDHDPSGS